MAKTAQAAFLDTGQEQVLAAKAAEIDTIADITALADYLQQVVCELLQRKEDVPHRDKALKAAHQCFSLVGGDAHTSDADKLRNLRHFSKETVRIVLTTRPALAQQGGRSAPLATAFARRDTDLVFETGVTASDVENPTAIQTVPPPKPQCYPSFAELFPAALTYRIRLITTFFHRRNPEVNRILARPFMLSPQFDKKFEIVIGKYIVPRMFEISRAMGVLQNSRKWDEIDTERFWEIIDEDAKVRDRVMAAWNAAWDGIKQVRQIKEKNGERTTVLVAPKILQDIRAELAPVAGDDYELPPVRNREIDLFISLMSAFNRRDLEYYWVKLRQLYEQEMDRRWYQDKARDGALRDTLLDAFANFSDQSAELLALLCYYNFPHINVLFLDRFTHNRGTNVAERNEKIPYLMRFLNQDGLETVRREETVIEQERRARLAAKKKASEETATGLAQGMDR